MPKCVCVGATSEKTVHVFVTSVKWGDEYVALARAGGGWQTAPVTPAAPGKQRSKRARTPKEGDNLTGQDQLKLAVWLRELFAASKHESRYSLAQVLGVDRTYVSRWLDAKNEPSGTMLIKLFEQLGVEVTPKPPDQMPRPLNMELADVREEVEALVGAVVEIQAELRVLTTLVRSQPDRLEPRRAERNTRP